jgi:nicotinamide-nucleotide amidase
LAIDRAVETAADRFTDLHLQALAAEVGAHLRSRGERIAVAESCTGGLIAKLFTDAVGSSAWFERGIVSYSNEAKRELLGVDAATLKTYGAVSAAVVLEMAQGLLKRAPVDWTLAVSGIAGPDGGTADKPVGTVWLAFAGRIIAASASRLQLAGDRDQIRRASASAALVGLGHLLG